MRHPPDRRPPAPSIVCRCLCGQLATVHSEAGRWFCAEHLPTRAPVPPPVARPPARIRPDGGRQLELPLP
ncbi:hypothetical protein [Methylobacterium nodulans]|uniref:Uncharacterized protein n=1 Tax=Methylobacterium nodulans (strain LMG 21967 / CNCM I-2342 / ORS 2060) TaxID=460265 RepID=B8IMX5_METNO|nr:hypothetical protein [Methylobacterium nodulans]ACL62091.1 hypothetical protein Mnod_7353 [Methylobacterium nodulans ORS 2060]